MRSHTPNFNTVFLYLMQLLLQLPPARPPHHAAPRTAQLGENQHHPPAAHDPRGSSAHARQASAALCQQKKCNSLRAGQGSCCCGCVGLWCRALRRTRRRGRSACGRMHRGWTCELRKASFEQIQPQTAKRKPSDDGQPLGLRVKACVHFKCSLAPTLLLALVYPKSKRMPMLQK